MMSRLLPISIAVLSLLQGIILPVNSFQAARSTSLHHPNLANTIVTQHKKYIQPIIATTSLQSSTTSDDPYASPELDTGAIAKYITAAATELGLFSATFQLLEIAQSSFDIKLPFAVIAFFFYACSLKSRIFNPLNNQRPDRSKAMDGEGSSGFKDRVMPSWTPPGVTFPIMWLLIIGPIRAYSSALVVTTTGSFLTLPTMAFMLHLTIGDVWNTINNTEKRYGASVIGVLFVVASAVNAAYQYSTVDMFAGKLLGATCLWLVTATALITDTWRLNPLENGKKVPLYPVKGEADTSFMWGSKDDSQ